MGGIEEELEQRIGTFKASGQLLEAQRIEQRTRFDLEMMRAMGYCHGIENYSRHLTGRFPGDAPPTLLDYCPKNYLLIVDESPESREVLKTALERHGVRIFEASRAQQGVALAQKRRPVD